METSGYYLATIERAPFDFVQSRTCHVLLSHTIHLAFCCITGKYPLLKCESFANPSRACVRRRCVLL